MLGNAQHGKGWRIKEKIQACTNKKRQFLANQKREVDSIIKEKK